MKLVDTMKDDELGLALLYNFTKGYAKPVPIDLYDLVLPLLYNDTFREEVIQYESFEDCILSCTKKEEHFKQNILTNLDEYQTMTSKALGVAMIQHILSFKIIDQVMCGIALETSILYLN